MEVKPVTLGTTFALFLLVGVGLALLLQSITERKMQGEAFPFQVGSIDEDEVDPAAWRVSFPRHYDSFMRTSESYGRTAYGGNDGIYDKLASNPFRVRAWAGYAFELEYNAGRGHYYAQIDQAESRRTLERSQPGTCLNCHAAEAPRLVREMGWEVMSRTPYDSLRDKVHFGSSCADCHMPYTREGGVKVSDHWIRSPLTNINNACQTCHAMSEGELERRVVQIQSRTAELLGLAERAITDLMDAIVGAQAAGVSDGELVEARRFHRQSQLRWDFVDAENSTGFHSPQEAARVLAHSADLARRGEVSALGALARHRGASVATQAGSR